MMGMNALFHLAAFVLISLLIYGLLVVLRQKRFLQELLDSTILARHSRQGRVYVDEPGKFLTKWTQAIGLPLHGEPNKGFPLRRLDPVPLVDLYLTHGVRSLTFGRPDLASGPECSLQFEVLSSPSEELRVALSCALGDDVVVSFNVVPSSTHEETSC
jgi:hypothetical protein